MHFVSDIIWLSYVGYLDTSKVSDAVVAPIPAAHPDLLRHLKHHFPCRTALCPIASHSGNEVQYLETAGSFRRMLKTPKLDNFGSIIISVGSILLPSHEVIGNQAMAL